MIEKGVSEEFTKHCTSIFRELEFPTDRIIVHKDDKQAYKARLLCMTIYQVLVRGCNILCRTFKMARPDRSSVGRAEDCRS